MAASEGPGTAKATYQRLAPKRQSYLRRARMCALYTQPALMPPEGFTGDNDLPTPYQGLGARGVNTLSSKLTLITLPPNQAPFKLDVTDYQIAEQMDAEGARSEIDEAFSRVERAFVTDIEATPMRVSLSEGGKQLLVAGSVLLFQNEDGSMLVYRLDQFVCRRTPKGDIAEAVIEEDISIPTLTPEQRQATAVEAGGESNKDNTVKMYTHFITDFTENKLKVIQEINGYPVPGSDKAWPLERSPLVIPTLNRLPNEHYGRSYVEDLLGDLVSYEGLSKFILEGASQMAKVLWLRNPNGVTRAKDLEKPNGSIINGNINDVAALRADKASDFQVALAKASQLERRLEASFLMNTSVQRPAERVTAEEIRFVAQELEDALGGTYAILAIELQLPIVKFQLNRMQRQKKVPKLPKGAGEPRITTGLSALGRGHDLAKIRGFVSDVANFGGPEAHAQYLVLSDLLKRLGAGHGLDTSGLIRTEKEIQDAIADARQNTLVEKSAPGVAKEVAKGAMDAVNKDEAP